MYSIGIIVCDVTVQFQHREQSPLKHTKMVILHSLVEKQALCTAGLVRALAVPEATC